MMLLYRAMRADVAIAKYVGRELMGVFCRGKNEESLAYVQRLVIVLIVLDVNKKSWITFALVFRSTPLLKIHTHKYY